MKHHLCNFNQGWFYLLLFHYKMYFLHTCSRCIESRVTTVLTKIGLEIDLELGIHFEFMQIRRFIWKVVTLIFLNKRHWKHKIIFLKMRIMPLRYMYLHKQYCIVQDFWPNQCKNLRIGSNFLLCKWCINPQWQGFTLTFIMLIQGSYRNANVQ